MLFGYFTLVVALIISAVAAYYSIVGLTAIFGAAVISIIVMGVVLEVGKVTAAVWLKINWSRARFTYKLYLVPAVAFLMLLTSMGIFGFLSKAHSDQNLISGDSQSKIAIYDEKIKTQRDNIELARRALTQMDTQVEARLSRGDSEAGAERAVQIRRQQSAERNKLQKEIADAQKIIGQLQEQRAPIAAEVRKVEAEVGPIKYIAALIYGDNPDNDLLERAVRWVIIIIVAVFDPLALVLILAAQQSLNWAREDQLAAAQDQSSLCVADVNDPFTEQQKQETEEFNVQPQAEQTNNLDYSKHAYLNQGFGTPRHPPGIDPEPPRVYSESTAHHQTEIPQQLVQPVVESQTSETADPKSLPRYTIIGDGYVNVEGKVLHERVLTDTYPEVLMDIQHQRMHESLLPVADNLVKTAAADHATFGTEFPANPNKGQMFLNVSVLPSRLYKFNGNKWISVDKNITDSYTHNSDYLQYLCKQISNGVITVEDLTIGEQEQIEQYLKKND